MDGTDNGHDFRAARKMLERHADGDECEEGNPFDITHDTEAADGSGQAWKVFHEQDLETQEGTPPRDDEDDDGQRYGIITQEIALLLGRGGSAFGQGFAYMGYDDGGNHDKRM